MCFHAGPRQSSERDSAVSLSAAAQADCSYRDVVHLCPRGAHVRVHVCICVCVYEFRVVGFFPLQVGPSSCLSFWLWFGDTQVDGKWPKRLHSSVLSFTLLNVCSELSIFPSSLPNLQSSSLYLSLAPCCSFTTSISSSGTPEWIATLRAAPQP